MIPQIVPNIFSAMPYSKNDIQQCIAHDQFKKAFALLDAYCQEVEIDSESRKEIVGFNRRFARIKKQKRADTITMDQESIELNKLTDAVLDLLESLPNESFNYVPVDAKERKVLVLSPSEKMRKDMEEALSSEGLSFLPWRLIVDYSDTVAHHPNKGYDLVVFNNQDFPSRGKENPFEEPRAKVLKQYLEDEAYKPVFFIHVGGTWNVAYNHTERVFTSNSFFTFYVWLKHALSYIDAITDLKNASL